MAKSLDNVSISTKIFAIATLLLVLLLVTGGIALYTFAIFNQKADELETANRRALLSEQINGLIYSVVADSRGIYMSSTQEDVVKYGTPLVAGLASLKKTSDELLSITDDIDAEKKPLGEKLTSFISYRTELVRLAREEGLDQARAFGDNDANRNNRKALNESVKANVAANNEAVVRITEEVSTVYNHAQRLLIGVILLAAIVGLLAARFVARRGIINPLATIREAMADLSSGKLDVEIPGESRRDEIGAMAGAVAVFKRNALEKRDMDAAAQREQKAKEERQRRIDTLLSNFNSSAAGVVASVSSASTELSLTAEQMTDVARRTSKQSGEVSMASDQTSQNVQSVASAAEEMAATVREIASQVARSTEVVNEATRKVDSADASSRELLKASHSIDAITVMIESIAGQINLLALNATIESARAGEAGRGFAVVASEVKNLATQATRATEQIREQLSSVQAMSQTVADDLSGVKDAVARMSEYSSTIAAAVEEQSAATNEIVSNMQTAAHGVDQIHRNVGDIRESADTTTASTGQVLDAAKLLSQQSEQLDMEVRTFLQGIQAA